MKTIKLLIVLVVLVFMNLPILGQVFTPNSKGKQTVYINAGLEPAVLTSLGYSYRFNFESLANDLILYGEASVPFGDFEMNDYRIKVGAQSTIISSNKWDFSLNGYLVLRGTENSIHSATNYGIGFTALVGYYESCWFSALELGYDKGIVTNIEHTEWYKEYFYSDAKDGLYGNPGGNITIGLRGGYQISNFEITVRGGIFKTEEFNNPVGVPYYGSIGINYHFCK